MIRMFPFAVITVGGGGEYFPIHPISFYRIIEETHIHSHKRRTQDTTKKAETVTFFTAAFLPACVVCVSKPPPPPSIYGNGKQGQSATFSYCVTGSYFSCQQMAET